MQLFASSQRQRSDSTSQACCHRRNRSGGHGPAGGALIWSSSVRLWLLQLNRVWWRRGWLHSAEQRKTALSRGSCLWACLQFPLHSCVLITFPRRTAAGKATWLVYINACARTHTHTRMGRQSDGWRKSQTSIRGAESSQRKTKGCNGCGPPQTGHQRKPRHGSEAWGAYQISLESSLRRWPPPPLLHHCACTWAHFQLCMNQSVFLVWMEKGPDGSWELNDFTHTHLLSAVVKRVNYRLHE